MCFAQIPAVPLGMVAKASFIVVNKGMFHFLGNGLVLMSIYS
jgi:hypothetical protein